MTGEQGAAQANRGKMMRIATAKLAQTTLLSFLESTLIVKRIPETGVKDLNPVEDIPISTTTDASCADRT